MSKFWQLRMPRYSDYHRTFINGNVTYPFGLPGIRCDTCGKTWVDSAHVIPFSVPQGLDGLPDLAPRPVSPREFREISRTLRELLAPYYPRVADWAFRPGQKLLPGIIDIPSVPEADFLWSGWCPVVSGRVEGALRRAGVTGATFFPATLQKIGTRSAKLPPPIPSSGEPEDIMRHARRRSDDVQNVPDYFHMVITGESEWPEYVPVESQCSTCGYTSWRPPGGMLRPEWRMLESMWTGMGVFRLVPTSMTIVTDDVRQIIQNLEPTNVAYDRI